MADLLYYKWFELQILHQYFTDGNPPISIVPTRETAQLLATNDIRFKQYSGTFQLYYSASDATELDRAAALESLGILHFEIIVNDPLFINYTAIPHLGSGEFLFFHSTANSSDIHIEIVSSEEHLNERNSIGILQINAEEAYARNLVLTFNAREVFWQYKIIIPDNRDMEIIDINVYGFNNEKSEGSEEELTLGDQTKQVFTFTSHAPLPLSQTYAVHPKLKLSYNNGKEIEIPLPNPSADRLVKLQRGINNGQFATTTFVYV